MPELIILNHFKITVCGKVSNSDVGYFSISNLTLSDLLHNYLNILKIQIYFKSVSNIPSSYFIANSI